MSSHYHHPVDVLRFAADLSERGAAFALVVATDVTGGTMRATGALMCVPDMGTVAGYISNGCVDADIIFQARSAIKQGQSRRLVYGDGSPFKDISLPCGGRIELVIVPNPNFDDIKYGVTTLLQRQSIELSFGIDGFRHQYLPKLRLRIAGKGEAVRALARQALETGFEVWLQSPESDAARGLEVVGFDHLTDPSSKPSSKDDPWTAVVLMFHDHEWEPNLLATALDGPAFYIGAMGSVRTHQTRMGVLREQGVKPQDLARVVGPIGLIPSMRDAHLLALSTLGEIVKVAQEKDRL